MNHRLRNLLTTAGFALAALLDGASAQENLPTGPANYEHDLQLFAPLELDLDNSLEDQWSGYFFHYDKLFWSYSGERVTVGSPNVVQFAEIIYRQNPQDEFDPFNPPPPPHQIRNTLNDVPPKAGFAFGNRYELGYQDMGRGWLIGVLDGPELNQTEFYGFARGPDGSLPPFIDDDYTDGTDIGPDGGPVQEVRAFGFGSVPVLFETPQGYLFGFRDYLANLFGPAIGTQWGPMFNVGDAYGAIFGEPDDPDDFLTLADDLDGDGIPGAQLAIIGGQLVLIHDFDDLHEFNVFFNSVTIRNTTETNGIELMWSHVLSNRHSQAKHQNNFLQLYYGARFLEVYDDFFFFGEGSFLGNTSAETSFTNSIVGPQVALRWVNQRQRWRLQADGRFMFGYNTADWDQIGLAGESQLPGALNKPLYGRPTAFSHGLQEREFSPVAELRLQAAYQVTTSLAVKVGYTGAFIGGIRRAAPSVRYALPSFGYADAGTQDLLINGFDLGIEFIH
jgi:hypothetical protein